MITKKKETFIDLREKPETTMGIEAPSPGKSKPRGPTLYIHDVDLPITEKDVDNPIQATVVLIPRRVSITKENGKTRKSFDIEVAEVSLDA